MTEDLVELAENAKEELKRADHSLFVSLKYTRTVDIIKGTIKRLINAFDISILELLQYLKSKKKIKVIPEISNLRAELVASEGPKLKKFIEFYFLLKKIDRAEYTKKEEYRKNVALISLIEPGNTVEVNIDTLHKYYIKTAEFLDLVQSTVTEKDKEK